MAKITCFQKNSYKNTHSYELYRVLKVKNLCLGAMDEFSDFHLTAAKFDNHWLLTLDSLYNWYGWINFNEKLWKYVILAIEHIGDL